MKKELEINILVIIADIQRVCRCVSERTDKVLDGMFDRLAEIDPAVKLVLPKSSNKH